MGKIGWFIVLTVAVILGTFDVLAWYRMTLLSMMHSKKCTRSGYLEAEKDFNPKDMDVELAGRTFLITGANSGIGRSVALQIASKGGTVHMMCRNIERGEESRKEIVEQSGNKNIELHILDLSDIGKVHRFVKQWSMCGEKLDVLIHNAAYLAHDRTLTSEGLEFSFATNTMGYYALTAGLLPALNKSNDARVIAVSSRGLLAEKLDVDDLQSSETAFSGWRAYWQHKRQQFVVAEELARKHRRVHFSTMDPGLVDTTGFKKTLPELYDQVGKELRTAKQGADTIVWLAAAESPLHFESGLLHMDRRLIPSHLPFGFTRETKSDRKNLIQQLEEISERLEPD